MTKCHFEQRRRDNVRRKCCYTLVSGEHLASSSCREYSTILTWTSVLLRTRIEIEASSSRCGQPEIRYPDFRTVRADEDVVGFQVPVVHSSTVAPSDAVDDLQEDALHQAIVPSKDLPVLDRPPHVASRAIVEDDVDAGLIVKPAVHGNNIRMMLRAMQGGHLAPVVLQLRVLRYDLHCQQRRILSGQVSCTVDGAEATSTDAIEELNASFVDNGTGQIGDRAFTRGHVKRSAL